MQIPSFALTLCLLAPGVAAQGSLWIVDESGANGADFPDIQAAIDAAASGDTLLVRSGFYNAFSLVGKGLSVVADEGALVMLNGNSRISAVPADQSVFLSGLQPRAFNLLGTALELLDNDGLLWIQDCGFRGQNSNPFNALEEALVSRNNAALFMQRCVLDMAPAITGPGAPALLLDSSEVSLFECTITGGSGATGTPGALGMPGGAGVEVLAGQLLVSGGTFSGGAGGKGGKSEIFIPCGAGGPGGTALVLATGGPLVELINETLLPGMGGLAEAGCAQGGPGATTQVQSGSLQQLAGTERALDVTNPVRGGEDIELSVDVLGGEQVWWLASLRPMHEFRTATLGGVYLLEDPVWQVAQRHAGSAGTLRMRRHTEASALLGPVLVFQQVLLHTPSGGLSLTGGTASLLLSASTPR